MFTLFKIARLLATALCLLIVYISFRGDDIVGKIIVVVPTGCVLALLWLVPLAFRHRSKAAPTKFRNGFHPGAVHDNIALDTGSDLLWVRDPLRGERYIRRADVMSARTDHDWRNGTFRQRIEIHIADTENPYWQVLFERHSDRWIKSSRINAQERDEWFARIKAWTGLATTR
ncbi:MAG TPA: hypothetical protein VJ806_00485 [Luteimonas sp.]|nr:hypothetical protein [Luteimonas sp.]